MHKKLLLAVFGLGLFLRVLSLTNHPAGFTPDEASFGYDAYSLLHTGRDQWGSLLPLTLKSFGDYKLPLLSYLAIPSVAIFGLNEFSIRFTTALVGSFAILATYFLVLEVSSKNKNLALLSAFFLALSPWHIMMSRGAFEANLTTLLLPLTLLFFAKGLKESKYFLFSVLFFGLNLFSYHSARFATPLILGVIFLGNRKKIKFNKWFYKAAALAFLFLLLTAFSFTLSGAGRLGSSGITSTASNVFNDRLPAIKAGEPELVSKLFNNKIIFLNEQAFDNYLQYFSPRFYFTHGPGEATYGMLPGRGVLYPFEILTLPAFIVGVARKSIKNVSWLLIWLVIAPIPAALALGPGFAANRAAIMMPALQIISATGAYFLLGQIKPFLKNKNSLKLFWVICAATVFVSFSFFAEDYWYQQPAKGSKAMLYGTKQFAGYIKSSGSDYNRIIIARKVSEPQAFINFYLQIDPKLVQQATANWNFDILGLAWVDQIPSYSVDKYIFKDFDWKSESQNPGELLIGPPEMFPDNIYKNFTAHYPDGTDAYWVVATSDNAFAKASQ